MVEPISRDYLGAPDAFEQEMLRVWEEEDQLRILREARAEGEPFVFYEGPPTANGQPGIHHVLARTLKDAVCRFWTMRGRRIERKAGWDTHGLPVELEVEKQLGISGKQEIERLGVAVFNEACRASVWTYKEEWERLSRRIGFLLDYENPYVTYHADYVESVWFLLSRFAANGLLYRGYKVLPWCGRCGTGLSSHEVGQGYEDVDDPSVWVSFPLRDGPGPLAGAALVAWTTTPWTLPSNMAACVHPHLDYAVLELDDGGGRFVLLEEKASEVFGEQGWRVLGHVAGRELVGLAYEPLFATPGLREILPGSRRHVVLGDEFVSAEEGTGIVHLAPYGEDDFRLARRDGIRAALAVGEEGRLLAEVAGVAPGTFFKDADKPLMADLKARGRLLRRATQRHPYPHCWRCKTPLLYFPAPAWFLQTTAYKDLMVEANREIHWVPPEIGSGRFGEWLENNVDWALSRDRYWGTPLPVWVCERDEDHWDCMGSFRELAERAGGLPRDFDPHRPAVDGIEVSCSWDGCGGVMRRVPQVIDCWFDSGAMPFAQYHWPFENRGRVAEQFPADFICEGLDQTRGWFYTLHAIATFLCRRDERLWASGELWGAPLPRLGGQPGSGGAYRSILVNGLVQDAQGRKMSKSLGNRVDPWAAVARHGVDAIRWSMLGSGPAHHSKRYSDRSIEESRRRVLGTLTASFDFLVLYAGTEGWTPEAPRPSPARRAPLDRWILARTAAAAIACRRAWESLEPHLALRELERLIVDELSNWYIRRSRRRFWGGGEASDRAAAFATLQEVLESLVRLAAPAIPFLADALWRRLAPGTGSVHLQSFPLPGAADTCLAVPGPEDEALQAAMDPVLRAARLGRAVRERVQLRTRQPLQRLLVHVAGEDRLPASPREFADTLREELNVKEVAWVDGVPDFLEVRARADYKRLGPRAGKDMKALAAAIAGLDRAQIFSLQEGGTLEVQAGASRYALTNEDVVLETVGVSGLEAATDGVVTIGLDTTLTPALRREGLARELVNRIQTQRKECGLAVSDRIRLRVGGDSELHAAVTEHGAWVAAEVLARDGVEWVPEAGAADGFRAWELPGGTAWVALERHPAGVA